MKYFELFHFKLLYSIVYNTYAAEVNPDTGDGKSHTGAALQPGRKGPVAN